MSLAFIFSLPVKCLFIARGFSQLFVFILIPCKVFGAPSITVPATGTAASPAGLCLVFSSLYGLLFPRDIVECNGMNQPLPLSLGLLWS